MAWQQISVITDEPTAPKLADFFSAQGAVSVTYMDANDEPVYEPAIGETKIWSQTEVIALFELNVEPTLIKKQVDIVFKNFLLTDWQCEEIADQEWERAWMEFYKPMKFSNKLWVCPTGQEQYENGTVCLTMDPGLAFGTGTHATTALCLEWLANNDLNGKTIIDYGCGSGILAIAAVLLGGEHAHAIDIDPQAITATQDNATKNNVQNKVLGYLSEKFEPIPADIVIANILAKPLIELADLITKLVAPKGQLILSGILQEQAESVILAYQELIVFEKPALQEDWIRLVGHRRTQ